MVVLDLLKNLFNKQKARKTLAQYKQDILVNAGREQFQYLLKKHISIPVAVL